LDGSPAKRVRLIEGKKNSWKKEKRNKTAPNLQGTTSVKWVENSGETGGLVDIRIFLKNHDYTQTYMEKEKKKKKRGEGGQGTSIGGGEITNILSKTVGR